MKCKINFKKKPNLFWHWAAQLEVLGDLLLGGDLLADLLGLLLALGDRESVMARESVSMFADLDLFAISLLVAGDLGEGLSLGDALLLNLDATELFGHGLNTFLAFRAIAVMGRAIGAIGSKGNTQCLMDDNEDKNDL